MSGSAQDRSAGAGPCEQLLPESLVSQTFTLPVRIYYADTDAGGVVYHSNYLTLAERARTEALRSAGRPHADLLAEHDCLFMVRRLEVEYLRPARLDDMLTITTQFLSETAATVSARQAFVHADGSISARLLVELVCVRASTGKPARTPLRWRIATAHADRLKT